MEAIWILYIVFILVGVAMLVFLSLFFRPLKTTNYVNANTLHSAYANGDGTLNVEGATKPFAVTMNQDSIDVNAATFSEVFAIDSFLNRIVANTFTVMSPSKVTNLQIVADFLHLDSTDTSRMVAIYDMTTSEQITSAQVSITDPVIHGFYTHPLDVNHQVTLEMNRLYAVVAQVHPKDFYARGASYFQSAPVVQFRKRAEIPNETNMMLPPLENFQNENPNNIQFASFQYVNLVVSQTIFEVDSRSQNATFPLNYIYNLNVQVGEFIVQLEPGVCISDAQNNNMLNNTIGNLVLSPEVTGVPNGLDIGTVKPNQWYAVFLITSKEQGLPPAGLLSENIQMPSFLPIGYDSSKRTGWARTTPENTASRFWPTVQQGNGTRRQTVYRQPWPEQRYINFTVSQIEAVQYSDVPLTLVSPTCSSVVLQLTVTNFGNETLLEIYIREFGSTTNVTQAVATGFNESTLFVEFPISNIFSPHRMQIALGGMTFVANDVGVAIQVVSFFDDV